VEALAIARLRDVTALFKTHQHSKDLRNGATEPPSHVALGESSWFSGEEFQYVETLLQGRRWISAGGFGFSSAHLCSYIPSVECPLQLENRIWRSSACSDIDKVYKKRFPEAGAGVGLQVLRVHGHCADKEDWRP
jgi:hypothetical protein